MTVAELTTIRTNILAALNGALAAGGVIAYGIGGKNLQKMNPKELWSMLAEVDLMIARAAGGTFSVAAFRPPE